jgi:hypothetical protein
MERENGRQKNINKLKLGNLGGSYILQLMRKDLLLHLTCHDVSDCVEVPKLLEQIESPIDTADGAYYHPSTYEDLINHATKLLEV